MNKNKIIKITIGSLTTAYAIYLYINPFYKIAQYREIPLSIDFMVRMTGEYLEIDKLWFVPIIVIFAFGVYFIVEGLLKK